MPRRESRIRFACALTAVAFLCTSGLTACGSPEERLAEHLRRGKEYAEQQRYAEAVIELRGALAIDPNDAEAHWALALAYRDAGDPRKAFWELQETLRLDPDNLQAKIYYSRTLALSSGEEALTEALATADEVVARDAENPEAHMARGRALQGLRRFEEAKVSFLEAARLTPDDGEPLRRLANVHRMARETEDAERVYREAAQLDPSFASFINLAVFFASLDGRDADAEEAFGSAAEAATGEWRVQAYGLHAGFLMGRDKMEEAEAVLRAGLEELGGSQPELVYALARFHELQGAPEEAEAVLLAAAEAAPGEIGPLLTLSTYRSQHGDLEGALRASDSALAIDPTDPAARLRKANLLAEEGMQKGDAEAVALGRQILEQVIESGAPNVGEALLVKGRLDLAEGRSRDAEFTLRRAVDHGGLSWRAQYLLGAALFQRGDFMGARTELAQALALGGKVHEILSLKARVHAALGESDVAVELGRNALRRTPGDTQLRLALIQAYVDTGRRDEARRLIAEVPEGRREPSLHFASGRLHELEGDSAAARESYEVAHAQAPHESGILAVLLDFDQRDDGRLKDSASRIEAALAARPADAGLARLAGRVAMLQGDAEGAQRNFKRAIRLDPNNLQAYTDLAVLLARTGQGDAVIGTYEQALADDPESPRLNLLLGMLYEQQGRVPDAIARYEVAARGAGGLPLAKNNLAYQLAETGGDLGRALELASEAKEGLPEDPNVADTLGWVLYKKDLPSAAVGYLREAERGVRPGDPVGGLIRLHLAQAYEANGEPVSAVAALERALGELGAEVAEREPPWAPEARAMLERLSEAVEEATPESSPSPPADEA